MTAPDTSAPSGAIAAIRTTRAAFARHATAYGMGFLGANWRDSLPELLEHCALSGNEPELFPDRITVRGDRMTRDRKNGETSQNELSGTMVYRVGHLWVLWKEWPEERNEQSRHCALIYRSPRLPIGTDRAPADRTMRTTTTERNVMHPCATPLRIAASQWGRIPATPALWNANRQPLAAQHPDAGTLITDGICIVRETALYAQPRKVLRSLVTHDQPQAMHDHVRRFFDSCVAALPEAERWKPSHMSERPDNCGDSTTVLFAVDRDGNRPVYGLNVARYRWLLRSLKECTRIVQLPAGSGCLGAFAFLDSQGAILALVMPVKIKPGPFSEVTSCNEPQGSKAADPARGFAKAMRDTAPVD